MMLGGNGPESLSRKREAGLAWTPENPIRPCRPLKRVNFRSGR